MYLSRIKIKNFRNFSDLDVGLAGNIVVVGENRVGKTNLLYALRLIFTPANNQTIWPLQWCIFTPALTAGLFQSFYVHKHR